MYGSGELVLIVAAVAEIRIRTPTVVTQGPCKHTSRALRSRNGACGKRHVRDLIESLIRMAGHGQVETKGVV